MNHSRRTTLVFLGVIAGLGGCGATAPRAEEPTVSLEQDRDDASAELEAGRAHLARIDATVEAEVLPAARACYERALEADPSLAGRLCFAFVVAPDGSATPDEAACTGSAPIDAIRPCVLEAVTATRFPPSEAGGESRIERHLELPLE